jgi:hypothetical protein
MANLPALAPPLGVLVSRAQPGSRHRELLGLGCCWIARMNIPPPATSRNPVELIAARVGCVVDEVAAGYRPYGLREGIRDAVVG